MTPRPARTGSLAHRTFDVWTSAKSGFDYSLHFPEWWERDVEAMVAKDYNHPSVTMYSIGNEFPEAGSATGAAWGRKLTEKVRSLGTTRYVANAVNGFLAVMSELAALRGQQSQDSEAGGGINSRMADVGDMISYVSASDLVTQRTASPSPSRTWPA
ncbi:MAG: hypothetical protein JF597_44045 [Streptomyces sp.]|uniref:glycoside hydrolase family 2 TIM barrel-domain containing protein n=1 Tax=Streptomyces sp. TaxID=1931 RepID=UPI0025CEDF83|nr:glycoside hydrolase family 2 TIM barrel-domain containing protein [Streptomyces sp.]MBW8800300.1 hypothetical protein [Streptomyces sp.]